MKKSLIVASFALALSTTGVQAGFNLDPTLGTGNTSDYVYAQALDWAPDNVLFQGILPSGAEDTSQDITIFGHGKLATPILPGVELTYIFSVPATVDNRDVVLNDEERDRISTTGGGYFKIFLDDNITGVGNTAANQAAGTGYSDGLMVLEASLLADSKIGSLDIDRSSAPEPMTGNGSSSNPFSSIDTYTVSGSLNMDFDISSINSDFFLDDMTVSGLDFNYTMDASAPRSLTPPVISAIVGGATPVYGDALAAHNPGGTLFDAGNVNGGVCSGPCDVQALGDSNMPFTADHPRIPEPTSLLLMGLGMLGLGAVRKARKA